MRLHRLLLLLRVRLLLLRAGSQLTQLRLQVLLALLRGEDALQPHLRLQLLQLCLR